MFNVATLTSPVAFNLAIQEEYASSQVANGYFLPYQVVFPDLSPLFLVVLPAKLNRTVVALSLSIPWRGLAV